MNALVLLADASGGGQIQEIARTFGVDWPHLMAQIISFGVVCALLYRFAYHPVLATLEQRRQRIAEGLANADKIKAELARSEAQRHEMMTQAGAHAAKFVEDAHVAASRVQQQETEKALAAAEGILADARDVARRDHERMLVELKREVGRLVVQTTAAIIGKVLTPEDQRRLAEDTAAAVTDGRLASEEQPPSVGAVAGNRVFEGYSGASRDESDQTSEARG
jgi:F-type H+-transporting ATPase subunit b